MCHVMNKYLDRNTTLKNLLAVEEVFAITGF
jgi:hypothetical protein